MPPKIPSRDQFARLVMDQLESDGETDTWTYDTKQFRLLLNRTNDSVGASQLSGQQHLASWYERYCRAEDENQRTAILHQFVDHWLAAKHQASSGRAADTSRILPLVRSRCHHEATKMQLALTDPEQAAEIESQLVYRVFAEHLALTIGEEFQHSYRQLTRNDLDQLGVSFESALAMAKDNLLRHNASFPGGVRFEQVDGVLWHPAGERSGTLSSTLLFTDKIRRLPLHGQPVAVVPHSETVWITGSENIDGLRLLSERVISEIDGHSTPISGMPFILDRDQWKPWLPPTTHPAFAFIKRLHDADASTAYDEQAELLKQKYLAQNRDVHLSVYRPMEVIRDDGQLEYYSVCVWTDSVTSLLPKTDVVAVVRLKNREALDRGLTTTPEFGETLCIPWKQFAAQVGLRLLRQQAYPERYLVDATLPESSWAIMASQQHPFGAELIEALAAKRPATASRPQSRTLWWIAGAALGCTGILVTMFVFVIVSMLAFMPRGEPRFVPTPPMHWTAFELPPFEELNLAEVALPDLSWQENELVSSSLVGAERPPVYKDIASPSGWLVGLRLTQGPNWGGAIRAIQPIYQTRDEYHLGDRHGLPGGVSQTEVLARPGYAIGEVTVRAGLVMNAIQVQFQRVKNERLDRGDTYDSEWVGCRGGNPYEPIRSKGAPIVGLSGSYQEDQFGLRIYQVVELDAGR